MKTFLNIIVFILASATACKAQTKPSKFFLSVGQGAGGSFFVRDYDEALPSNTLGYKAFLKKKFVGIAQEITVGIHLKKNIDLKFGYNRQRFTRRVLVDDTVSGVGVSIDHRIQHVDNSFLIGMSKNYIRKMSQLSWGSGLYYWTGQLHTIEVYPRYIIDRDVVLKGSYSGDLGAYAEMAYEYKFQPKVNIGIKGQFFWILSGSYANSVALFPFIKLNF
jgi:hypothetical protein